MMPLHGDRIHGLAEHLICMHRCWPEGLPCRLTVECLGLQHDHPIAGARRQARRGNELLHHGLFRSSAVRQNVTGMLAHRIGAPHTVVLTGAFCAAGVLWFTLDLPKIRAIMRPIYQEMGLLPARDMDLISNVRELGI